MCILLEQECQFFNRLVDSFWEKEVDEDDLKPDEYAVAGEILPASLLHPDRVDKGVEE